MRLPLFLLFLAASTAPAQDPAATLKALEGKDLPIRDFLAAPVLRYHWQAGQLIHQPLRTFTLGVLHIESVTWKQIEGTISSVDIKGLRRTPTSIPSKEKPAPPDPVDIQIDLHDADPSALGSLPDVLFYPSLDAAIADLPQRWVRASPVSSPTREVAPWVLDQGSWHHLPAGEWVDRPKPKVTPEPEFSSEQAKLARIHGNAVLGITLDPTGTPVEAWLLRPIGFGLDEKALLAAMQYRFTPPKYAGRPVGTIINLEINFQIF